MTIKMLNKLNYSSLNATLKLLILQIRDECKDSLTKSEFVDIVSNCLNELKASPTEEVLNDFENIFIKMIKNDITKSIEDKKANTILRITNYIDNEFENRLILQIVKRNIKRLESFLESEKYFPSVSEWQEILAKSTYLNDNLKIYLCNSYFKCGNLKSLSANLCMQYLFLAYANVNNLDFELNPQSNIFKILCQNNSDDLQNIMETYKINTKDLGIILDILKNYFSSLDILKILPQFLENYSPNLNSRELMEKVLDFYKEKKESQKKTKSTPSIKQKYDETKNLLTFKLNRVPTNEEIALQMKIPLEELNRLLGIKMAGSIYDYLGKDIIYPLIKELPLENQMALQVQFGRGYDTFTSSPTWSSISQEKLCLLSLNMLKEALNKKLNAKEEKPKTIDKILNVPFSICKCATKKLNEAELIILKAVFGSDLKSPYNKKVITNSSYLEEYNKIMQKLGTLVSVVTIYDYLEISEEEFRQNIVKVPEDLRSSLFKQWNNFSYRYIPNVNLDLAEQINIINAYELLTKGTLKINVVISKEEKEEVKNTSKIETIYDYFGTSEEVLNAILINLSKEKIAVLQKKFGENYDNYQERHFWDSPKELHLFRNTCTFIKKKIENYDKEVKTIYEYFKTNREILDPILDNLLPQEKEVLQKKFGENYDNYQERHFWDNKQEQRKFYNICALIKKRIENFDEEIITIYEYFETSREILDPILANLSIKQKEILKKKFGENYTNYQKRNKLANKQEQNLFYNTCVLIKKRIENYVKETGTIYDYFETSEEILKPILDRLSNKEKKVLKIKFGQHYNTYNKFVVWKNEEDKRLYHLTRLSILRKIKNNSKLVGNIYEYFETSKEILDPILANLSPQEQAVLQKKFGKDYNNYHERCEWSSKQERNLYLNISKIVKNKINKQNKTIYEYFKTSEEVLNPILDRLSPQEQALLQKKFSQNYDNYQKFVVWENEEDKKLYQLLCLNITRKLKNNSKLIGNIYEYFETSEEVLKPILEDLSPKEQEILQKKFGKDYNKYHERYNWSSKQEQSTFFHICRSIKNNVIKPNKTIYEYLDTSEEVLRPILDNLSSKQKDILQKKFGENYDNYQRHYKFSNIQESRLYSNTLQRIKNKIKKLNIKENESQLIEEITKAIINLKNSNYQSLLDAMSLKEIIIIYLLSNGYLPQQVAEFAKVSLEEITSLKVKYETYNSELLTSLIDELNTEIESSYKLKREKPSN